MIGKDGSGGDKSFLILYMRMVKVLRTSYRFRINMSEFLEGRYLRMEGETLVVRIQLVDCKGKSLLMYVVG